MSKPFMSGLKQKKMQCYLHDELLAPFLPESPETINFLDDDYLYLDFSFPVLFATKKYFLYFAKYKYCDLGWLF